ncbi:LysR family transcriptional regulator [Streptomyces djakartensis]|uniref:LysR family transcriptional regulator n=1 Tax=Streptomyces djakartensis TaxID=68193 RepID=UPI0034DEE648
MDIRDLRYAVTLAEELHFGRAAQRHYISPQPFGRRIQQLEHVLGVTLFKRTSRRVTVTSAGERIIADARAVLASIDSLSDPGGQQEAQGATLRIGILGFGLAEHWARFVDALRDHLSPCVFVYSDLDFVDQYEAVSAHRVDAAVVHYTEPIEGLAFERVLTMPRVAVVPAESEFADAERLSPADLDGQPWVPVASPQERLARWVGRGINTEPDRAPVRRPAAIPDAVSVTGRLSMHAAAAARFYPHRDVRFVPLDGPPCEIAVATRASDCRPAVEAVRRCARLIGLGAHD